MAAVSHRALTRAHTLQRDGKPFATESGITYPENVTLSCALGSVAVVAVAAVFVDAFAAVVVAGVAAVSTLPTALLSAHSGSPWQRLCFLPARADARVCVGRGMARRRTPR